jgi:acyl dehydratase
MIEWFDDLALGMRFKSGEVQITENDIKRFAAEYDPQPMHLDEVAAAETLFKGLAASGRHTAAIAMNLAVQIRPFGPHPLIGLGVDGLRWMIPVRPDETSYISRVKLLASLPRRQSRKASRWLNGRCISRVAKLFIPSRRLVSSRAAPTPPKPRGRLWSN